MTSWISFDYVREHASFEPVLEHYGIKIVGRCDGRKGRERRVSCPFHEDRKPSASINIDEGKFKCHSGNCGHEGDVLDFVTLMEGFDPANWGDLRKGAKKASEICDIALSEPGEERKDTRRSNGDARRAQSNDKPKDDGNRRGRVKPEVRDDESDDGEAECWNEPMEPRKRDNILAKVEPWHPFFEERGFMQDEVEHFGMCYMPEHGSRSAMRNRVLIPIHNGDGELVAFACRWANEEVPDDVEKYLLPKQFVKTWELFNLHRAIALGAEHVTVVEGYFSAMRLHLMEVPAVALMGSSISDAQVRLLCSSGVERVTLLLDGDDAGRKAGEKVLPAIAAHLFVRAGELPDGQSPDDCNEEVLRGLVQPVA